MLRQSFKTTITVLKWAASNAQQKVSSSWFPNVKVVTSKAKWSGFLFLAEEASPAIKWSFMSHQMARNSVPSQELSLLPNLSLKRNKEKQEEGG